MHLAMLLRWLRGALLRPFRAIWHYTDTLVVSLLVVSTAFLTNEPPERTRISRCIHAPDCNNWVHEDDVQYPECWSCYREHAEDIDRQRRED